MSYHPICLVDNSANKKKQLPASKNISISSVIKFIAVAVIACANLFILPAYADHGAFHKTEDKARGQTVWFAAWAGSEKINAYLRWAAEEVDKKYGVKLKHFKLENTADAVRRVLAEKSAGKHTNGAIDLIWINGENFRTMKEQKLLFGPFADRLPNDKFVDHKNKPATVLDFTIPTDGFEAAWGTAQLVFVYDQEKVAKPPRSINKLLAYAKQNPGRFTYPAPPDFIGTTFLKQALYDLIGDSKVLAEPAGDNFDKVTSPLWQFLDQLHPALWQKGQNFPKNWPKQNQLLNDGEVYFSLTFNPGDVASSISQGTLPKSARGYVLKKGTIGNAHFVAIPYNANAKEGAQVVANFLLSPEAQARKADLRVWGDPTVLAINKLTKAQKAIFAKIDSEAKIGAMSPKELGKSLPEPHPSWGERLAKEWQKRYGG